MASVRRIGTKLNRGANRRETIAQTHAATRVPVTAKASKLLHMHFGATVDRYASIPAPSSIRAIDHARDASRTTWNARRKASAKPSQWTRCAARARNTIEDECYSARSFLFFRESFWNRARFLDHFFAGYIKCERYIRTYFRFCRRAAPRIESRWRDCASVSKRPLIYSKLNFVRWPIYVDTIIVFHIHEEMK